MMEPDNFFTKTNCDRCGRPLTVRTMSRFNEDCICLDCDEAERQMPEYKEAEEAEIKAVREGNYNFKGIGLPKG